MWGKLCKPNLQGINMCGQVFSVLLYSFYFNKITNSTHILSIANTTTENQSKSKKSWDFFLKLFNKFKRKDIGEIERVEFYFSSQLKLFLGDFKLPTELSDFRGESDLISYDKDGVALDCLCGVIPLNTPNTPSAFNIINKNKTVNFSPQLIGVYTNLPLSSNINNQKHLNGKIFNLLIQIPLKKFNKYSLFCAEHFSDKISYKNLSLHNNMNSIEIVLIDESNGEPINLIDGFIVELDFKQTN